MHIDIMPCLGSAQILDLPGVASATCDSEILLLRVTNWTNTYFAVYAVFAYMSALFTCLTREHSSTNTLDHTCSITQAKEEEVIDWLSLMRDSFEHLVCQDTSTYCIDSWQVLITEKLLYQVIWHIQLCQFGLRNVLLDDLLDF